MKKIILPSLLILSFLVIVGCLKQPIPTKPKKTEKPVEAPKFEVPKLEDLPGKLKIIANLECVFAIRVIDGDTIEVKMPWGREKIRYIGIDTPETKDPRKPVEYFGKEAAEKNRELVEAKYVFLEKDVSNKDRYGRFLRYVYLADGTFVNLELVKQGYAQVATYPPDLKYVEEFLKAEKEAREKEIGLWSPPE